MSLFLEVITETLTDSLKTLPFLFLAYLLIETLEHKAAEQFTHFLRKNAKAGPLVGATLGMIPQCGFSVACANLYAGGIISAGTFAAVILSTSDEALPILLASGMEGKTILFLLALKFIIALFAGFLIDFLYKKIHLKKHFDPKNQPLCQHCHCTEGSILRSAFKHTLQIFIFILLMNLALNGAIALWGEDRLSALLAAQNILQPFLIAFIGLIPNCAPSVIIAELYMAHTLPLSSAIAGLLTAGGMGLAVLLKVNQNTKQNILLICAIYLTGAISGMVLSLCSL